MISTRGRSWVDFWGLWGVFGNDLGGENAKNDVSRREFDIRKSCQNRLLAFVAFNRCSPKMQSMASQKRRFDIRK